MDIVINLTIVQIATEMGKTIRYLPVIFSDVYKLVVMFELYSVSSIFCNLLARERLIELIEYCFFYSF